MIVCHCRGLSDRKIREVIRRGAHSPREVAIACHAGRSCGGCIPTVRELIASETSANAPECAGASRPSSPRADASLPCAALRRHRRYLAGQREESARCEATRP